MTIETLISMLSWLRIDPMHFSLKGGLQPYKYVYSNENDQHLVYFCEGFQKKEEQVFNSEAEAISYFYRFIASDPASRNKEIIFKFNNPLYDKKLVFTTNLLIVVLNQLGINPKAYSIMGIYPDNQYVLNKEGAKWYVCSIERGKRLEEKTFYNEDEACRYFLWYISFDPTVRM